MKTNAHKESLKRNCKKNLIRSLDEDYPEIIQANYALSFLRHIHGSEWAVVRWIVWGRVKERWNLLKLRLPTKKNRELLNFEDDEK